MKRSDTQDTEFIGTTGPEPMVSANEIGKLLRLSGRCVTNHFHEGVLPGYRIGKKSIRFLVSEVLASVERQNQKISNTN